MRIRRDFPFDFPCNGFSFTKSLCEFRMATIEFGGIEFFFVGCFNSEHALVRGELVPLSRRIGFEISGHASYGSVIGLPTFKRAWLTSLCGAGNDGIDFKTRRRRG